MNTSPRALIMAGGTGGHIFPGIALAQALLAKQWQVDWIGTADRMEADIVPKHGIPIHYINVKGIRGNGLVRKLGLPLMLLKAFWQAVTILKEVKPDVVVGFGGYASGPGGLAAKWLGIPLIFHEQNAVMGMTNRYLSRFAKKTLLAFPIQNQTRINNTETFEVVGNPVRADIAKLNSLPKRLVNEQTQTQVLVIGGSLGAQIFNQELATILAPFIDSSTGLKVRHQSGKGNSSAVLEQYKQAGFETSKVDVFDFIDDMPSALEWADIIICRAGALTVSEVAASGNAAIFVPLPHAVDDHQTANAQWLVSSGAARMVKQQNIKTELPVVLKELLHAPTLISEIQLRAKQNANLGTTDRMLKLCQTIGIK